MLAWFMEEQVAALSCLPRPATTQTKQEHNFFPRFNSEVYHPLLSRTRSATEIEELHFIAYSDLGPILSALVAQPSWVVGFSIHPLHTYLRRKILSSAEREKLPTSTPTMKVQPAPRRDKSDLSRCEELPPLKVEFVDQKPTIMDNPLPATAARLAKRQLEEQLISEAEPTTTPSEQSLSSSFPVMPSDPTPDTILEWLGSSQHASFFSFPGSMPRSCSSSTCRARECKAAKLSMAKTLPPKAGSLHASDGEATVEHIEHKTEEKLVTVLESRLQMLEAKMQKSELMSQLYQLEKDVLKISLSGKNDFVTNEQQILEDDADFKTLQKSANVGLELLEKIQYDNPICRDNPSVYQEAYDQWVALRQSVATYLLNRCGDQRENEAGSLAELDEVKTVISKLGDSTIIVGRSEQSSADSEGPKKANNGHKKPPRRDSGNAMLDTEPAPYFPSSPSLAMLLASNNTRANDPGDSGKARPSATFECVIKPRYELSKYDVNSKPRVAQKPDCNTQLGA
ncbi:hypothetical protein BKA64DRAFT_775797 [Cadophora sp. MPI-SDFR-AT-0126]|nr:hypothetical protein BKA64DRAFT_775797 [Leotiomycetes sp. MPI-SDFR-AT-0126]